MHKKYHEEFKILDILAVTTQAHEGIETGIPIKSFRFLLVTTQAYEGIETFPVIRKLLDWAVTTHMHPVPVTGKKRFFRNM